MLSRKFFFGISSTDSANYAASAMPKTCQIVLFSATFPEFVMHYAHKVAPQANEITLKHEELTVEGIKQLYMDCNSEEHKYQILVELYNLMTVNSSIIFVKACFCLNSCYVTN